MIDNIAQLLEMARNKVIDQLYLDRLNFEEKEIYKQGIEQYWVDLYNSDSKYSTNKNGLVLPYLLGITTIDPIVGYEQLLVEDQDGAIGDAYSYGGCVVGAEMLIERSPGVFVKAREIGSKVNSRLTNLINQKEIVIGEVKVRANLSPIPHNIYRDIDFPDIDLDFLPEIRETIKNHAVELYGSDKVCSVGSWTVYKVKSALQDTAKSLGYDDKKKELLGITPDLPDDFDAATFEDATSDEYPKFKEWYDASPINKEITELAYKLVGKIRNQGKHAGGLIISRVPLIDQIPMSFNDGKMVSEWTEGMARVELSKFGFVKYDILGLTTLGYIWHATKLIKKNKGIEINWDEVGLGDNDALSTANNLKTVSVFQFDTGIAKGILRKGGVKSFNDLLVYSSLGRPGPMPMIDIYIARRDDESGAWKNEEHPKIVELFYDTYGICVYQEQLTAMLTKFGGFSVPEADKARKLMSKKWADKLLWVRVKALKGFSQALQGKCPYQEPDDYQNGYILTEITGTPEWTWAKEYWKRLETFARYSFNKCLDGDTILIDPITGAKKKVRDLYESKEEFHLQSLKGPDKIKNIHYNGKQYIFKVEFRNGVVEHVTNGHKYLCFQDKKFRTLVDIFSHNYAVSCNCGITTIDSINCIGVKDTYSPEMKGDDHCYAISPDPSSPIQANSHAVSYTLQAYRCLYLKTHFPEEWWCGVLNVCDDDKYGEYIKTAKFEGTKFRGLNYRKLSKIFDIKDGQIVLGLNGIKCIGEKCISAIDFDRHDYVNIKDFTDHTGKNKILLERLIKLGAFDDDEPNRKKLWYWYLYVFGSGAEAKEVKDYIKSSTSLSEEEIINIRKQKATDWMSQTGKTNVPKYIKEWKPKAVKLDFEGFMKTVNVDDFSVKEMIAFQEEYLGYHWDSPIEYFKYDKECTIEYAKSNGIMDCFVLKADRKMSKKDNLYLQLRVTDGFQNATIRIWEKILEKVGNKIFTPGNGLKLEVIFSEEFNSFTLPNDGIIRKLALAHEHDKYLAETEIM